MIVYHISKNTEVLLIEVNPSYFTSHSIGNYKPNCAFASKKLSLSKLADTDENI